MVKPTPQKRSVLNDFVIREYTIRFHRYVFGRSFRKRTPHAVKAVKSFAEKAMGTKDVRLDPTLNRILWSRGVKHINHRMRVRIVRRRNDDENAKEKFYSSVTHIPVTMFKHLTTVTVELE
jgi:large subunit ribosomal protein L31e